MSTPRRSPGQTTGAVLRTNSSQSPPDGPPGRRARPWWHNIGLFVLLITVSATAAFSIIRAIGKVTNDHATGAMPSSMYHATLTGGYPLDGHIDWRQPVKELHGNPTPGVLSRVTTDWAAIWYTMDQLHSNAPVADPSLVLGDSLLHRLQHHQPPAARQTVTQLRHVLRVDYYSLDGSVIGITAISAEAEYRFADSVTGHPLTAKRTSSLVAVLVLTDGRWRMRSLQRVASPLSRTEPATRRTDQDPPLRRRYTKEPAAQGTTNPKATFA